MAFEDKNNTNQQGKGPQPPKNKFPGGNNSGFKRNENNDDDDNNFSKLMRTAVLWIIVIGGGVILWFFLQTTQQNQGQIDYNVYFRLVEEGKVKSAVIENQGGLNNFVFHGKLRQASSVIINDVPREISQFSVPLTYVDRETEEWWRSNGVTWKYKPDDGAYWGMFFSVLPWIALIAIYIIVMRRMQNGNSRGIFSFGKSRARLINENSKKITFEDVAGADEAKYELEEIIEFLRDPGKFQKLGGKIPRGVLLLGPPGTGKTLLARAVAGEANVPFFSISGADFVEMFVGVGASRVRDLFEQAKKNSPCIVFIDEIDAVGRHRGAGLGGGHDEREQTLNQLLVEMDGFEQNGGTIVIAATNRPDVLDPALLRPGRFDRQVVVDRPDVNGRVGILKVHTRNIPLAADVDLEVIAKGTPGLSGADLANLVNEAALLAARRNSSSVDMLLIEDAKDKILMGVERRSMVITDDEKETTAYHEMGHALAGLLLPGSDPVHKVTIIPRGRALGVTSYLPSEQLHTMSKDKVHVRIVTLLAGRAAEKLVFGQLNTGAMNDLERATALARKMVCEWGMSDKIGPVYLSGGDEEPFLGRELSHSRHISEETAQTIDMEVRRIIQESMDEAEELLRKNMELLHRSSKLLLEREVLDAVELKAIVEGTELPPVKLRTVNSAATDENESTAAETTPGDQDGMNRTQSDLPKESKPSFAKTLQTSISAKEKIKGENDTGSKDASANPGDDRPSAESA